MKIYSRMIGLVVVLACSATASAMFSTSRIQLGGGQLQPNSQLEVSLAQLRGTIVPYVVTCQLTSGGSSKDPVDISVAPGIFNQTIAIVNNGMNVYSPIALGNNNVIEIRTLTAYNETIVFQNLDDSNVVNIVGCVAIPDVYQPS